MVCAAVVVRGNQGLVPAFYTDGLPVCVLLGLQDHKSIEEQVISATHELVKVPDWGANMAIVDLLQRNPAQYASHFFLLYFHLICHLLTSHWCCSGSHVLKALRARVTHKDPHIALLGLAVRRLLSRHSFPSPLTPPLSSV